MSDETNTPEDGIEDVTAQAPDTAENLDWFDPDEEDQDTEEVPEDAAPEDGAEEEDTAEEAEVVEAEATVDAVVTLNDGKKVKVADLIAGNLRQDDYTRKTQEIATARKTVQADAERIERITTAFIDHLSAMVPPAPDSALALRDPSAYVRAKAQHEAALEQVKKLIDVASEPKQIVESMTKEERDKLISDENSKLAARIPEVSTDQGRRKFFESAAAVAQDMGFTMDELNGVTDHRIFVLAHYAKIGMDAMKARTVAKTKAQAAPPVAPRKPGNPAQVVGNDVAKKRFERSPTLRNAAVAWSGD